MLSDEQIRFYRENGYLQLKDFFTDEEVESFRKGCERNAAGDTTCRSEFKQWMLSPKVVAVIHALLGERLYYPGLSLTRTNDKPLPVGTRFFHTDTVNEDGDYETEYGVINTGVYLEDHTAWSGGLKIRPGSHLRPCITNKSVKEVLKKIAKSLIRLDFKGFWQLVQPQRSINVASMPRDLLLWSVRTHHSGYSVRPNFAPSWSLPPTIENLIPSFLRLPDNPERNVMLSIYGAPSKYFENYMKHQIRKAHRKEHFLGNACLEDAELQRAAKALGVEIRNDGYRYAMDPKSEYDVHPGLMKASGGQQYYG